MFVKPRKTRTFGIAVFVFSIIACFSMGIFTIGGIVGITGKSICHYGRKSKMKGFIFHNFHKIKSGKENNHFIIFYLILVSMFVLTPFQSYAHVDEGENIILSRFVEGKIVQNLDSESEPWDQSAKAEIELEWEHEVFVSTINNSTHVFFLLSWDDPTKDVKSRNADGAVIILEKEPKDEHENEVDVHSESKEEKEIWMWSASKNETLVGNIITKAEWNDDKWRVLFEREIGSKIEKDVFVPGVKQEDSLKLLVWDASRGESFEDVGDEKLGHFDFIMLPEIDTQPKDSFVWLSFLVAGALSFAFVERRLHTKMEAQK